MVQSGLRSRGTFSRTTLHLQNARANTRKKKTMVHGTYVDGTSVSVKNVHHTRKTQKHNDAPYSTGDISTKNQPERLIPLRRPVCSSLAGHASVERD